MSDMFGSEHDWNGWLSDTTHDFQNGFDPLFVAFGVCCRVNIYGMVHRGNQTNQLTLLWDPSWIGEDDAAPWNIVVSCCPEANIYYFVQCLNIKCVDDEWQTF